MNKSLIEKQKRNDAIPQAYCQCNVIGSTSYYKNWEIVETMPDGYKLSNAGSPLHGHLFIIDKSPIRGGKLKLLKVKQKDENHIADINEMIEYPDISKKETTVKEKDDFVFPAKSVNTLARLKFKEQLMKEILFDLTVCEIEGWDKKEYVKELKKLINSIDVSNRSESLKNQVKIPDLFGF